MSDLIQDLADRTAELDQKATGARSTAAGLRANADAHDQKAESAEAEARQLRNVLAMLTGEFAALAPGDITGGDDLGLSVGIMRIAPPADASTADLRLYLGTVRRVYELAMHQSRVAADEIHRREGREGQATLVTGELPVLAIAEQLAAPDTPEPVRCIHCGKPIRRDSYAGWVHDTPGVLTNVCRPDARVSPYAEPPAAATADPFEPLPPNAVDARADVAREVAGQHIGQSVTVTQTNGGRLTGILRQVEPVLVIERPDGEAVVPLEAVGTVVPVAPLPRPGGPAAPPVEDEHRDAVPELPRRYAVADAPALTVDPRAVQLASRTRDGLTALTPRTDGHDLPKEQQA